MKLFVLTFISSLGWILLAVAIIVAIIIVVITSKNSFAKGNSEGYTAGKRDGIVETDDKYRKLHQDADRIIIDARTKAENEKQVLINEAKAEINSLKQRNDREIEEKKRELSDQAKKLDRREDILDERSISLDKREDSILTKENKLDERREEIEERSKKVEELIQEQETKLYEIAQLTKSDARNAVLKKTEEDLTDEIAVYMRDELDKAKYEATRKSQVILANAIQQYANETIQEKTVSVVSLPNDEMKGRIIGREGRNIRAIEQVTGVDLIIDDTPDSIVISCFDPVRREIARRTLEILIQDGRIQPPRIEEVFAKCTKELELEIREAGEKAVFETGVGKIHPELVKIIGRLQFRTSYGQNVLSHSKEVAFIAGKMAAEIGEDEILARRAGLLHDIGKATDHETEGSHVDIGVDIATKFKENETVIDAIASHHGDCEAKTVIAVLVAAADTLSAARPGARSESLDSYIKRLEQLEELTNSFAGVEKSYALQAGREVRIMVKPEEVDDAKLVKLTHDIKQKIESTMQYPGTIKVVVIRETRVVEVAR